MVAYLDGMGIYFFKEHKINNFYLGVLRWPNLMKKWIIYKEHMLLSYKWLRKSAWGTLKTTCSFEYCEHLSRKLCLQY